MFWNCYAEGEVVETYLVTWINKPLSSRVVLVGSSPQKVGFLVYNWSVALAEARDDSDSSRVYLPLPRVFSATILKPAHVCVVNVTRVA